MVRGIFEKKLNCLPLTKLGLEAEFRHDYESAIDTYEQVSWHFSSVRFALMENEYDNARRR